MNERVELNRELGILIRHIEEQIDFILAQAREQGSSPYKMMYSNGQHILPPLLLAKAQALNAKVNLNKEG